MSIGRAHFVLRAYGGLQVRRKCYPCREVFLNYSRSLPLHGGYTGSPVRDANSLTLSDAILELLPLRFRIGISRTLVLLVCPA
jgi:hypothetical protein